MKRDAAPICTYAIYDSPRDFPNQIVVRVWQQSSDGRMVPLPEALTFNIASAGHRAAMIAARKYCRRLGLVFLPRNGSDDPVIVETWNGRPQRIEAQSEREAAGAALRRTVLG